MGLTTVSGRGAALIGTRSSQDDSILHRDVAFWRNCDTVPHTRGAF